jgi:hypothetical protein
VDYMILTRMRDTACLCELYKRYCRDLAQWRFIELYEYAVSKPLGYLIIDFISHNFKYRLNSLNLYFNTQNFKVDHIVVDEEFREQLGRERDAVNMELAQRFLVSGANFKRGAMVNSNKIQKPAQETPQVSSNEFKCLVCLKDYSMMKNPKMMLMEHMYSHDIIMMTNGFCCRLCKRRSIQPLDSVIKHLQLKHKKKIVEDDNSNPMQLTQNEASTADDLTPTTSDVPVTTSSEEWKCSVCHQDFTLCFYPKGMLEEHMIDIHKINIMPDGFLCGFCQHKFSNINDAIGHMLLPY